MDVIKGEKYLTSPRQYALVYRQGFSWVADELVLKATPNGLEISRYGFSISKKVGNAVTRNKVKRRLREIMRVLSLAPGWDIVFIAKAAAAKASYASINDTAIRLLADKGLLRRDETGGSSGEGT